MSISYNLIVTAAYTCLPSVGSKSIDGRHMSYAVLVRLYRYGHEHIRKDKRDKYVNTS